MSNWYEEPTHWKRLWFWERLRAGGEGETEDQTVGWHHPLNGHEFEQTLRDNRKPGMLQSMGLQSRTWLNYWTTEQHIMGDQLGDSKTGSGTQTVEWTYLSDFNVQFSRFLNVKCKYPHQRQHFNWNLLITPPFSIHCSPGRVKAHSVWLGGSECMEKYFKKQNNTSTWDKKKNCQGQTLKKDPPVRQEREIVKFGIKEG